MPVLERGMAGFSPWAEGNWFNLIQSVGIIGSLWFTAASFQSNSKDRREDTKARKVSNILALSQRHREIWADSYKRDDLKRIFLKQVDLEAQPATIAEIEYLRERAIDFEDGWEIALLTNPEKLRPLALDACEFFSRPLPRLVWEQTKEFRNPKFVLFVERAIERSGRSIIQ